ncbi:hypothetical protein DIS18_08900 [Algibacter marinivivus]|uniref:Lipoprotein n=1 Tax=Algibacter marinivivus TaxID=2100723 RepID=A0A2U2X3K7_9FLAO|nr:hypothetical protein [Algibacter marinivivus]PWH82362.1 hypothetical protein DIS18_08900 [Algibacter marinivivus]
MIKNVLRYSLVFIIIFISTSCIQKLKEAAENISGSSKQPESISASNFSTVTVSEQYELSVPKYMKNMPNLHDEASLEYANIFKETYTVVIEENKQNFIDTFKEFDEYNDELSPIENYKIIQKQMFREAIEDVKIEDYGLTSINSLPARQFKMSGIVDGLDFFYLIGFVSGKENIYMIMNWTLGDRRMKYENTFEYINSSFNEL